ncbi:chemotaxis protein CheB [Candidatus Acetatifactor stercoripullorum]|uniref:chemotaxis protein CheB n=1 Tax=Candidatus Acetatifactor stercoripullorum TaxID=2838414 RepID=UPI00298D7EDF|nr:chemotaxis protein CheB [Candidatus Acetatifactor stercoripullorum]
MKEESREESRENNSFCVVGIGASAGGLEALQDFFKELPENSGAAYVVIQHLSPDYKSIMDELLRKCTSMPVMVVEDGMEVLPDHVYLIPPKKEMTIRGNSLMLTDQGRVNHVNLAIDIFFKSLAEDCGKYAIGVVLSGAGSDGTQGSRYIKEYGGMVMVQEPSSATFNSMPVNAIQTGHADYVLEPAAMGAAIVSYMENLFHPELNKKEVQEDNELFRNILVSLKEKYGIDFSDYKEQTIRRRLERRVSIKQFRSLSDYYNFFKNSREERECLLKEFLIGVTGFFRDKDAFEYLRTHVFPDIEPPKGGYRIWSVACSTGEEAYTLAILLTDYMEKNHIDRDFKIFATDIDRDALNVASAAVYADSVASAVPAEYLQKYFTKIEGGYKVNSQIRKRIIFSVHDVLVDPPFSKLDLLVCRNLFIYLKPTVQQGLLQRFYYSLNPNGYLFMGNSESIGEMSDVFLSQSRKYKIYQKKEVPGSSALMGMRLSRDYGNFFVHNYRIREKNDERGLGIEKIVEQAFSMVMPLFVIVNEGDNIVYTGKDISRVLQIGQGVFTQNIFANLPHGLGIFVNGILRKLKSGEQEASAVCAAGFPKFPNQNVIISGYRLETAKAVFYLLTFEIKDLSDLESGVDDEERLLSGERITDLEEELRITRENLQATIEELETANEELQSTNEELVAANEELQSTNEELQSVNEELYTVNSEYQSKLDEMTHVNMDMDNLLNNVEVGALYLDDQFRIRKITPMIPRITHIMDVDVGRPISHLSLMDTYPNWKEDIQEVFRTRKPLDREISEPGGRFWLVRIRPYRTDYNAVEGIIMTFVEATELRMMKNSTFANAGLLYWQRENSQVLQWRYRTDIHLCTIYKTGGFDVEKEFTVSPEEFYESLQEDDRTHIISALKELRETDKKSCELTCRLKHTSEYGLKGWIYLQVYKLEQKEGGGTNALQGTVTSLEPAVPQEAAAQETVASQAPAVSKETKSAD